MITRAAGLLPLYLLAGVCAAQITKPPGNYAITPIVTNGVSYGLNNYGQVVGVGGSAWLWTPVTPNGTAGNLIDLGTLADAPAVSGAQAINDKGQVTGYSSRTYEQYNLAFLWTPDMPNGTTGTMTEIPGNPGATVTNFGGTGINNYGEVVSEAGAIGYLWLPSAPNGTAGAVVTDQRFLGANAINNLGQVVITENWIPPGSMFLFTPSTPNSAVGTFVTITGPGGRNDSAVDINQVGAILGETVTGGNYLAWVWTPSLPNGASGSIVRLPLPSGFSSMWPRKINSSGQVVGMLTAGTQNTPFLYSGGVVYDLSLLSPELVGGQANGINDSGQIVVRTATSTYLLTPMTASSPVPGEVSVTIASNGPGRMFTVSGTGCRPGGYTAPQTLGWIPGSSCVVTFVSPHSSQLGTRYLFSAWEDGVLTNPRTIVAPGQPFTYAAEFSLQFFVRVGPNIPGAGAVNGGGWYNAGSTANLIASPAAGYRVADWSGAANPWSGFTAIKTLVGSALTVTANFEPFTPAPAENYAVTLIADLATSGLPSTGASVGFQVNNYGQVVGAESSGPTSPAATGYIWTPNAPNGTSGVRTNLQLGPLGGIVYSINDRGQAVGVDSSNAAFLWSPYTPNGTAGVLVNFAQGVNGAYSVGGRINNFGQIAGLTHGGSLPNPQYFLWTPDAPNGVRGTLMVDSRLSNLITAINDYGQAVTYSDTLFTPSKPNGTAGGFSTLPTFDTPTAINSGGTVSVQHGQLWTPTAPNGTAGTLSAIPVPPGYQSVEAWTLNTAGDVAGDLVLPDGAIVPMLYSGGTAYDLSIMAPQLRGGTARWINDRGQILVNIGITNEPPYPGSGVYLLTPQPTALAAMPSSGNGFGEILTVTFTDAHGSQDLDVVDVLINSALDGRNACYVAYSRTLNMLYLVNDGGSGLLPGVAPGGTGSAANHQCIVNVATSSVAASGNGLTLTLDLAFAGAFAGSKIVYAAARDVAQNNSGWQALGTWAVPGATAGALSAVGVSPPQGAGPSHTFTFTFTDTNGWPDLGIMNVLIHNALDGRQSCYLAFSRGTGMLYLMNDAGTALLPGIAVSGAGSIGNSQCTVSGPGSSGTPDTNTYTLTLNLSFAVPFGGNRVVYAAARDAADANGSGWVPVGVWLVQ